MEDLNALFDSLPQNIANGGGSWDDPNRVAGQPMYGSYSYDTSYGNDNPFISGEYRSPSNNLMLYKDLAGNVSQIHNPDAGSLGEFLGIASMMVPAGMAGVNGANMAISPEDLIQFDTEGASGFGAGGWDAATNTFTGPSETFESLAPFMSGAYNATPSTNNSQSFMDKFKNFVQSGPGKNVVGKISQMTGGNPALTKLAGGNMDFGSLASVLGSQFMGNRQANAYGNAINSLNDLYSPNSPYAQYMRQALERKDAAAGRRSQYGPREAQLMGMLAQAHGNTLTSPGYVNMLGQRNAGQNMGLNNLFALMGKGGPLNGIVNKAGSQLSDMFSNWFNQGSNAMPSFDMGPSASYENTDYSNMPNYFNSMPDLSSIFGS